jgi:hypothetical protein
VDDEPKMFENEEVAKRLLLEKDGVEDEVRLDELKKLVFEKGAKDEDEDETEDEDKEKEEEEDVDEDEDEEDEEKAEEEEREEELDTEGRA